MRLGLTQAIKFPAVALTLAATKFPELVPLGLTNINPSSINPFCVVNVLPALVVNVAKLALPATLYVIFPLDSTTTLLVPLTTLVGDPAITLVN